MHGIGVAMPAGTLASSERVARRVWLQTFLSWAIAEGYRVVAPQERDGVVLYGEIRSAGELTLPSPKPVLSLKELFLAPLGAAGNLEPALGSAAPGRAGGEPRDTLIVGCRPCEAAALVVLDAYFMRAGVNGGYVASRRASTIISFACVRPDGDCFCTSVGGGPGSAAGADILASRLPSGAMAFAPRTAKGEGLLARACGELCEAQAPLAPPELRPKFDLAVVRAWLSAQGRHARWPGIATSCVGCGVCRFLCPTCHCFEMAGAVDGCCGGACRSRDCCALSLFTPRDEGAAAGPAPSSRWRQWLLHKFVYFPEAFGRPGCVGCGQCLRACGAGENLVRVLQSVERAARAAERN